MARTHWTLNDLPWDRIDRSKVDDDLLKVIKAAALVEYNAGDYAAYLASVFADDPEFQDLARAWAVEEVQHGAALGRWAEMLDPGFSLERSFAKFTQGYKIDVNARESVRGSRSGELIARCMVETGTSSYYTAIADATTEPVLKAICRHIAADELRHYKMFYSHLRRYLDREALSRLSRLRIAFTRIRESEDDELAYAYYAANGGDEPYDRRTVSRAYFRRAYSFYRVHHVERVMAMIFKACGFRTNSLVHGAATRFGWWMIDTRVRRLVKAAA
jgi:rubrerythrin